MSLYNNSNISASIITDGADLDKLFKAVRSCFSSCKEIVICANGKYEEVKFTFRNYSKVKVFPQVWEKDFSKARNECIDKCNGDWIFVIDSDEELQTPIEYVSEDYNVYLIKMFTNFADNPSIERQEHWEYRLFKNNVGSKFVNKIHEQLNVIEPKPMYSSIMIEQAPVTDNGKIFEKIQRNSEILSEDKNNKARDFLIAQICIDIGKPEKALVHSQEVLNSEFYQKGHKALAAYWAARVMREFHKSTDQALQYAMLSIMYEPKQIMARVMITELLEEQKASKELILNQYKLLEEINNNKNSKLPLDMYVHKTFLTEKIERVKSWQ